MGPAVVFLIFNRPAETARSFAAIRAARPQHLLVVADGPRAGRPGDHQLCSSTREVVATIDWPCRVLRNYANANMGCGLRVSSGLDWAFANVEQAVILEDDCLPDASFFPFCAELLERYRDDERVMMVSGNNFQDGAIRSSASYYFSQFPHCWGWATWRRAWKHFDLSMSGWPDRRRTGWLRRFARDQALQRHWRHCFDGVASGRTDAWDYQWMYSMWARQALSIVPCVNLVTNIGFGGSGTHTLHPDVRYVVPCRAMEFPLRHPEEIARCRPADAFEDEHLHRPALRDRILWTLRGAADAMRPGLQRVGLWKALGVVARRLGA